MDTKQVPVRTRGFFFHDPFFQINWEKFEGLKTSLLRVSGDVWNRFRQYCSVISFFKIPGSEDQETLDVIPFPRRYMLPDLPGVQDEHSLYGYSDDELVRWKEDEDGLEITLDTHLYTPGDIKVAADDGRIIVHMKHEKRSPDLKMSVLKEFKRTYLLPEGLRKDDVFSDLSADGVLVISALKPGSRLRVGKSFNSGLLREPEHKKFKYSPNLITDDMDLGNLMSTGML